MSAAAALVALEPPEPWTIEDVDQWLAEAHDTLRRLYVRSQGPAMLRSSMPVPVPEPWVEALNRFELGLSTEADGRPPPPSAQAIGRMDVVERWLVLLTVEQLWVVRRRAAGLSWRQMSQRHSAERGRRRSFETLRSAYRGALGTIVAHLNRKLDLTNLTD